MWFASVYYSVLEGAHASPVWDAEALNASVNGQGVGYMSVIEPVPRGADLHCMRVRVYVEAEQSRISYTFELDVCPLSVLKPHENCPVVCVSTPEVIVETRRIAHAQKQDGITYTTAAGHFLQYRGLPFPRDFAALRALTRIRTHAPTLGIRPSSGRGACRSEYSTTHDHVQQKK